MFSIIACIGKNRELGRKNGLVFHIKEDMKFFKNTTTGHKVVMGHKTWDSLPAKLPKRENIVISRSEIEGADLTVTDLASFIDENKDTEEEIFVIGGGMVYFEFLKYAKRLYLTEVDAEIADADTFFPEFDQNLYEKKLIGGGKDHDLTYNFVQYQLK